MANALGVSRSSVSYVVRSATKAISEHIRPKHINFSLTREEVEERVSKYLEQQGYPECIGSIVGTHIEVKQLKENYTDFLNCRRIYSSNVPALCDYRYVFNDVVIRWQEYLEIQA